MDDSIEKDRGIIGIGPDTSLDLTVVFLMEKIPISLHVAFEFMRTNPCKTGAINPCEMFAVWYEEAFHVSFSVVTNASIVNCLTLTIPDT